MKKQIINNLFLFIVALLGTFSANAQYDTLFMHNGTVEEVTIQQVSMKSISFRYKGEEAGRTISKHALRQISYRRGRVELPSPYREMQGDSAWTKVMFLSSDAEAEGLRPVGEISSHTSFINFHTSRSGERKARKKLQQAAAKLNCPFVLITVDREVVYGQIKFWGFTQNKIRAIAYSY